MLVRNRYHLTGGTGEGMPRADTMLYRMRANPRDWRIASLEAVARANGVNLREAAARMWSSSTPLLRKSSRFRRGGQ